MSGAKQVDYDKLFSQLTLLAKKTAVDAAVLALVVRNMAILGNNPIPVLRKTMQDIADVRFGKGTRPHDFMMHFLNGKGKDYEFSLWDLLNADKSVRARVISEISRRVRKLRTAREEAQMAANNAKSDMMSPMFPDGIDPVITIFQYNYEDEGWKNSLGTFDLRINHLICRQSETDPIPVYLSSQNIYKWVPGGHGQGMLVTDTIHRIGKFLVDNNAADDFKMVPKDTTFFVNPSEARILEMKVDIFQVNPRHEQPLVDFDTTLRMIGKVHGLY